MSRADFFSFEAAPWEILKGVRVAMLAFSRRPVFAGVFEMGEKPGKPKCCNCSAKRLTVVQRQCYPTVLRMSRWRLARNGCEEGLLSTVRVDSEHTLTSVEELKPGINPFILLVWRVFHHSHALWL